MPGDDEDGSRAEFGVEHGGGKGFGEGHLVGLAVLEDDQGRHIPLAAGGPHGSDDGLVDRVGAPFPPVRGDSCGGQVLMEDLERGAPQVIGLVEPRGRGEPDDAEPGSVGDHRFDQGCLSRSDQAVDAGDSRIPGKGVTQHLLEVGAFPAQPDERLKACCPGARRCSGTTVLRDRRRAGGGPASCHVGDIG